MNEFFLIAEITSAGKDGYVKILGQGGFGDLIENNNVVYVDFWNQKKALQIEDIISGKNSLYVKFKGFDDKRDISLLFGRNIFIKHQKDELEEIHQVYLGAWRIGTHRLSGQLLNKPIYRKLLYRSLKDLE